MSMPDPMTTAEERRARMRRNRRAMRVPSGRSLFEDDAGAAIESVGDHAGPVWRDHALEVVWQVALELDWFTVQDVTPRLESSYDLRAVGAVMREAARRGWCTKDGYVPSDAGRHGRIVTRWRSLLRGVCR